MRWRGPATTGVVLAVLGLTPAFAAAQDRIGLSEWKPLPPASGAPRSH